MSIKRRIVGNFLVSGFLCWLGAQYIRLVYYTSRWTVLHGDIPGGFWDRGEPFIGCFWHGRLMMMLYGWDRRRAPVQILISRHRDGRLIARTIGHFGIGTITGSTSKGGTAAARAVLRVLNAGNYVAFTPDGPRGPRMRMSPGIIDTARLAGVPIVTGSYSVRRRWVLGTWDRLVMPLPFTRGVFVFGEPVHVARDADAKARERARKLVEDRLNAITDEADRRCGWPSMAPAG
ncbi:MAG: lysophospholipid acyltransferase family protein, partial [Alphaproteobacteria bacterium]